jgi:hypothetical protein
MSQHFGLVDFAWKHTSSEFLFYLCQNWAYMLLNLAKGCIVDIDANSTNFGTDAIDGDMANLATPWMLL